MDANRRHQRAVLFHGFRYWLLAALVLGASPLATGQQKSIKYGTFLYKSMQWREIGPFRGGRSIAVAGHKDQKYTYYFGATGGGIWKTEDGGATWLNVSDGYLNVGVVGALEVAESDPNVIYAGTGESCIRGNVMPGEGVYKSMDAGKSWEFIGLGQAQTISRVRVHPKDANVVYVAALGHVFGENPERGIYRSLDGGRNWKKILYKDDKTGAADLVIDPFNPRVLYASLWEAIRTPWSMSSGGPGSGLWKSTDGGDTWRELTNNPGMPKGLQGRIGVAASGARSDLVWAMVEAEDGGLYRSNDGGKNWRRVNDDRRLRQRAWYYSHVYADPRNPETVYILNVGFHKSIDGGRTLTTISAPHGDHHDLWIDPTDPLRMVNANDGGANVSYNGGLTWSEQDLATAQFYGVTLDDQFPYKVYGAQQDNSTIGIASRTTSFGIDRFHWHAVGGGESGYIAVNREDPNIVYAGSYGGLLTRYDHRTGETENITVWPDNPMGAGVEAMKYRFQWTYPIITTPHDSKTIYVAGNHLFKSTNEGKRWDILSPDLTRNDKSKMGSSGGPITKDNTSVEYYGTIFTVAESPMNADVLWTGSDDGLIHLTRDGGTSWVNVTPKDLPEWSLISIIEASPHDPGTAYFAATRYKLNDFRPFIYKTGDFGKTWKKIVNGIPEFEFTRAVREDPHRKGLLYAGTERGMWVSFDDGTTWQTLQLNLPIVPIHGIAIQAREKDLVVATHGRSFWILDDLTPLHQLSDEIARSEMNLFTPRHTYRMRGGSFSRPGVSVGKNPPSGVVVSYSFRQRPKEEVKLEFLDAKGSLIKSYSSRVSREEAGQSREGMEEFFGGGGGAQRVSADSGMNRFVWDMRYEDATSVPGGLMWAGTTRGPLALPGTYQVRLTVGEKSQTRQFEIKLDPRSRATEGELVEQFDFLIKIRDRVSKAHEAVNTIREIRKQLQDLNQRIKGHPQEKAVLAATKSLDDKMTPVEEEIIQVKIRSSQDALNYPIKLNNKIAALTGVVSAADAAPTKQSYDVFNELSQQLEDQLVKFRVLLKNDLPQLNETIKSQDVPAILLKPAEKPN
ncbi:MAG: glycosyl hydrolase [Ignavibacteria bacterium]|nr:glycosyl hydrolase [Ignavibacteria bacterium]